MFGAPASRAALPSRPGVAARPDGRPAGRLGLTLVAAAIALVAGVGLLGPSAAAPPLPSPDGLPPYAFASHPSPYLVTGMLLTAALTGGAGMWLAARAVGRGWRPPLRALTVAAVCAPLALALVPPMGSADHLVYAVYGRLAVLGLDPYTHTAHGLAAVGDPIGRAAEPPWTATPSVYGPVGTAEQWLAAVLGGDSPHRTVAMLAGFGALAFVLTTLMLARMAGDDPRARARALLLFGVNPLLLFEVVGGAHIDAVAVMFAVAGLLAFRAGVRSGSPPGAGAGGRPAWWLGPGWRLALAGALTGAACAVKLSYGLWLLALAWPLRRAPRRLAAVLVGAATVLVGGYLLAGPHALDQARANARLVSFATVPRLLLSPLGRLLGPDSARTAVSLIGWALMVLVVVALARLVPRGSASATELDPASALSRRPLDASRLGDDTRADGLEVWRSAVRAAFVLNIAWLLTAPYSLPWYDVAAWAALALLPASGADLLTAIRTTVMTCAYVPGRVVVLPPALDAVTRALRGAVAPVVGVGLLMAVAWWWARVARRPPEPPAVSARPA